MTTSTNRPSAGRDDSGSPAGWKATGDGRTICVKPLSARALASLGIIAGLEGPEDWQEYRAAKVADLEPVGEVETLLAERVALLKWRLRWAVRQEQSMHVRWRRTLDQDPGGCPARRFSDTDLDDVEHLRDLPPDKVVNTDVAHRILQIAHDRAYLHLATTPRDSTGPGLRRDQEVSPASSQPEGPTRGGRNWTARDLWQSLKDVYQRGGLSERQLDGLLRGGVAWLRSEREAVRTYAERKRLQMLRPDLLRMERILRYKSRMQRAMSRSLRDLRRLQAQRRGVVVTRGGRSSVARRGHRVT